MCINLTQSVNQIIVLASEVNRPDELILLAGEVVKSPRRLFDSRGIRMALFSNSDNWQFL